MRVFVGIPGEDVETPWPKGAGLPEHRTWFQITSLFAGVATRDPGGPPSVASGLSARPLAAPSVRCVLVPMARTCHVWAPRTPLGETDRDAWRLPGQETDHCEGQVAGGICGLEARVVPAPCDGCVAWEKKEHYGAAWNGSIRGGARRMDVGFQRLTSYIYVYRCM